jgi:putative hydrolase
MSSDDIFSRLFELFDQPGPVNWKLANEVARHLAGERQAVDPFAAEELRELGRLAEYRLGEVAPFPIPSAPDLLVLDGPQWAEAALERLAYLAEALSHLGLAEAIPGIGASLVGMQVGSLAGSLAGWVMASFESGLPLVGPGPLLVIGPAVESFQLESRLDSRQTSLWVAAEETAHRAIFGIPWVLDHLRQLIGTYGESIQPDPQRLLGLIGQGQEQIEDAVSEAGGLEALLAGEESVPHREELESYLALAAGYRRILVRRAVGELLPDLEQFAVGRVSARPQEELGMGLHPLPAEQEEIGTEFCAEVERRFGEEALDGVWLGPERLPHPGELTDPVGWAARVLLDDQF